MSKSARGQGAIAKALPLSSLNSTSNLLSSSCSTTVPTKPLCRKVRQQCHYVQNGRPFVLCALLRLHHPAGDESRHALAGSHDPDHSYALCRPRGCVGFKQ